MSSTNGGHSSLIVLSNLVYAKRRDGNFYPGSIGNKTNGTYIVVFDDGTTEHVPEEDLTWLGFWGLAPCSWPKTPVIQSTSSSGLEFDGKVSFVKADTDVRGHIPASLIMLKNNASNTSFPAGRDQSSDLSTRSHSCCGRQRFFLTPRTSSGLQDIQEKQARRPSVLMLNRKVLSKELGQNNADSFAHFTPRKEPANVDLCLSSSFQSTLTCIRNDGTDFENTLTSTNLSRRAQTRNPEVFERINFNCKSREIHEGKCPRPYEDEKDELERERIECQARNGELSPRSDTAYHQSWDWYETSYFNRSALTPPVTPSSLTASTSPELPPFDHEAPEMRMAREQWGDDTKGTKVGPWKKRRKDDLKKCRKVYGVLNRHLWCTQCKWKKACSRFKA